VILKLSNIPYTNKPTFRSQGAWASVLLLWELVLEYGLPTGSAMKLTLTARRSI
jgi:hypothetical protein